MAVHLRQHTEAIQNGHYNIQKNKGELHAGPAPALHDIGKIAIDDKILNKPGRLTTEEFEIMMVLITRLWTIRGSKGRPIKSVAPIS